MVFKQKFRRAKPRTLEINEQHINDALTPYLWSMRLIKEDEVVTRVSPSDNLYKVELRKEVSGT